jgi:hypothetical protein
MDMESLIEKPKKSKKTTSKIDKTSKLSGEDKGALIAERAYYKFEARGYEPGLEMQDWLDAEAEITNGAYKIMKPS